MMKIKNVLLSPSKMSGRPGAVSMVPCVQNWSFLHTWGSPRMWGTGSSTIWNQEVGVQLEACTAGEQRKETEAELYKHAQLGCRGRSLGYSWKGIGEGGMAVRVCTAGVQRKEAGV